MQIIAVRIDTQLMRSVLLVIFFNKEEAAFWAILLYRFKVADKITLGIICAAVKFFSPAFSFSRDHIAVTLRAFRERYGFGIPAFRKSRTRKEESKASQFLH